MMKKVGIITLYYGNDNYGGIAQAYALNEYINRMGLDAEMISYKRSPVQIASTKDRIKKDGFIKVLKEKIEYLPLKLYYRKSNARAQKKYGNALSSFIIARKKAFAASREAIPHSKEVTENTIKEIADDYDLFISGSDQIWKPGVLQPPYVLTFLNDSKKRFSYASSITMNELPKEYGEYIRDSLNKYQWISVREQSAKQYLETILDRNVDVVVDPTLLLSEQIWENVADERQVSDDYMFVYLLGDNFKQRKSISKLAKKKKLKIVTLPHVEGSIRVSDINFGDIQLYDVDLAKFLSLIKYANYVCTDSFHAVVFSNIFETNFSVFERIVFSKKSNMNSRLDTLLQALGEEYYIGRYGEYMLKHTISFKEAKKHLLPQIEKSKRLLNNALEL